MNFYQRMGILPLKKRVNRDKCSFATKQRMFGVFAIDEILRYRGSRIPGSPTLCHPVKLWNCFKLKTISFRIEKCTEKGVCWLSAKISVFNGPQTNWPLKTEMSCPPTWNNVQHKPCVLSICGHCFQKKPRRVSLKKSRGGRPSCLEYLWMCNMGIPASQVWVSSCSPT